MAGDWIKFRSELWTHPKFIGLFKHLYNADKESLPIYVGVTEETLLQVTDAALLDVTMGALLRVWCMVNSHCKVEGNNAICEPMSPSNLDGIAKIDGFGYAMEAVGWVRQSDDMNSLIFENFLEFNEPACLRKAPALTNAERQARYRENHRVTKSNESNAREEKRREEIKDKSIVRQKPDVLAVLNFLNEKTGRAYQPVRANVELIAARMAEGASVDDLRAVIAKKCREWAGDEKMAQYLRPKTLFSRTNFANYRGEIV